MEQLEGTGIRYNPAYFHAEFLKALFFDSRFGLDAQRTRQPELVTEGPGDPSALFEQVWQQGLQDEDFREVLTAHASEKSAVLRSFLETKPLDPEADQRLAETLAFNYQVVEAPDGSFVHAIDGETILTIPRDAPSAASNSNRTAFIISVCKVAVDVLMLVAAAAGVALALMRRAVARTLSWMMTEYGRIIIGQSGRFEALGAMISKADKIIGALRIVHGTMSVWDVTKNLLSKMTPWDWAKAVAEVVFNVGLLILSGGVSVLARMLTFAAVVAMFVVDIVDMVNAYHKWRGAETAV